MKRKWDWLAFCQILASGTISLLILFAINRNLATNQFVFWILGLCIFYVISHLDFRIWLNFAKFLYGISILLLVLLFIFGEPIRGSVRWIDVGFFRIQPSELAKAGVILALAAFFKERSAKDLQNIFYSLVIVVIPFLLVLIQPDIGSSLTFLAIWLGVAVVAGIRPKHLAALVLSAAVIAIVAYELLAPYQKQRLITFISPEHDPLGTGYNIIQSKIAAGSGNLLGRGFGQGSQSQLNFLPEAESDFMFASISEQLGLVGAGFLVIIFSWLIWRIVFLAREKERYSQLVIIGVASLLIVQFTINVGMNLALLPVTGIPFPLVSYGGSSMMTTLLLLGIVFAINRSYHRQH